MIYVRYGRILFELKLKSSDKEDFYILVILFLIPYEDNDNNI